MRQPNPNRKQKTPPVLDPSIGPVPSPGPSPGKDALAPGPSSADGQARLLHGLEVHRIELVMQNEALRQSQGHVEAARDRLSDLFEFAPTGYLILNPSGKILDANLTACALLYTSKKRLLGERFQRFVEPADAVAFHLFSRQVTQSATRQSCELRLAQENGALLHVQIDGLAVATQTEQNGQLWLCLTAINLPKPSDRAQRESATFKSAILNSVLDPLLVIDHDGKILELNSAAEKTFGYTRTEVFGQPLVDVIMPPSTREWHRRELTQHGMELGEGLIFAKPFEANLTRRNGSLLSAELTVTRAGSIRPPIFTVCIRNIGRRKRAEEDLEKSLTQLRTLSYRLQLLREDKRDRLPREIHDALGQVLAGLHLELSQAQSSLLEIRSTRGAEPIPANTPAPFLNLLIPDYGTKR